MIHKGTNELITKRLILKRFKLDDAEVMFCNWTNDLEVTRFLNWDPHGTIEVTKCILETWVKEYENLNCYNWAIIFDKHLIGSISLLNPNDDICEAEAGYCMSQQYWGMGIMTEALSSVLKYAFDECGFHRILAKHNIDNPNSGRVMKKCHMNYIERKYAPLALNPEEIVLCDCYEIFNPNLV